MAVRCLLEAGQLLRPLGQIHISVVRRFLMFQICRGHPSRAINVNNTAQGRGSSKMAPRRTVNRKPLVSTSQVCGFWGMTAEFDL